MILKARVLQENEYGYDYPQAIREISHAGWSYEDIAQWCRYESRTTIHRIMKGSIPPHPEGEALYILYVELFHRKPPLRNVAKAEHASTA